MCEASSCEQFLIVPIHLWPLVLDVFAVGECLGFGPLVVSAHLTRPGHWYGERCEPILCLSFVLGFYTTFSFGCFSVYSYARR